MIFSIPINPLGLLIMPVHIRALLMSCFLIVFSSTGVAVVDIYQFDTASQRERYHALSEELRCPKCQNQNLAGSDSQIAGDLRRELHRLLLEGHTDREIKTFMVNRYGDFVLYKPRLQKETLVLWVLPFVLLSIGVLVLSVVVSRRKVKAKEAVDRGSNEKCVDTSKQQSLSEQEQSTLNNLLVSQPSSQVDTSSKGSAS